MDSRTTLPPELSFWTLQGERLWSGPREWQPSRIVIGVPFDTWDTVGLRLGGIEIPVALERWIGEVCVVADWERQGAGHHGLCLTLTGRLVETVVTIQPEKISPNAFVQLLTDLHERLPAEIAIGLQRNGAMTGIHILPPSESTLAQELLRLRRAVGTDSHRGLADILPVLGKDPHQAFVTVEPWVRRDQVRRPHPARLAQALVRPGNLDEGRRLERVADSRVEHTVDTYENRLVKVFVHQLHLRLHRLLEALSAAPTNADLLGQAQALHDRLATALRHADFLNEVRLPEHLPSRISMVLMKRAPYRAALERYLEFNRSSAVHLETPALKAPLENLPYLYQLWGTLEVLATVLELSASLGYEVRRERLVRRRAGVTYIEVLPNGTPALELLHRSTGTIVSFIPERTYSPSGVLRSVSFQQRPDIAIEVRRPGETTRVYLFDPKYKLDSQDLGNAATDGRPVKMDIDKMHAYRDAIRTDDGHHVVVYAATLYPGPTVLYGDSGIAALSGDPGVPGALRDQLVRPLNEALSVST